MLKTIIESIIGTYQAISYEVHVLLENPDGSTTWTTETIIPAGVAGIDWAYVGALLLFAVTLFCTLKIIGGVIKRG